MQWGQQRLFIICKKSNATRENTPVHDVVSLRRATWARLCGGSLSPGANRSGGRLVYIS